MDIDNNSVEAAAELGRALAQAEVPEPYELSPETSLVVRVARDTERTDTLDLERYLARPRRRRGFTDLHEPHDFVTYVTMQEGAETTVWADESERTITAVFNDNTATEAGWRDHTATLRIDRDRDWVTWLDRDGMLADQEWFAELLETQAGNVIEPDAATMLEIANNFQATRTSTFGQKVKVESGDVQLSWTDETTATAGSGHIDIPRKFTLSLSPLVGADPQPVEAHLRYRVREGRLGIGYKLLRPEQVERRAFVDVMVLVGNGIEAPVLRGSVPGQRR
jgi:uncharacterized protein YfdQ (DUF2303 family)